MTASLQQAFAKAAKLSEAEQEVLAARLLAELAAREENNSRQLTFPHTVWSPFDAFGAAATLLSALEQEKAKP